jgi:hypothetical protein
LDTLTQIGDLLSNPVIVGFIVAIVTTIVTGYVTHFLLLLIPLKEGNREKIIINKS